MSFILVISVKTVVGLLAVVKQIFFGSLNFNKIIMYFQTLTLNVVWLIFLIEILQFLWKIFK